MGRVPYSPLMSFIINELSIAPSSSTPPDVFNNRERNQLLENNIYRDVLVRLAAG